MSESHTPGILVVDDNAENRMLITEYLDDIGLPIDEADCGEKCLEMLAAKPYTLVIMDIQMPGLNGFEVLEYMRKDKNLAEVPVMFVSTVYDSDPFILKGITGGAIDFLAKPININILKSKVTNFIKLYDKQAKLDQANKKLEQANQLLKGTKRKLKGITESASDSIILLDHNFKISFWNKSSNEIFGYSKYEILTENFLEKLVSPNSHDYLAEKFKSLVKSSDPIIDNSIRLYAINKNGKEFPVELSLSYFNTTDNQVRYTVIIRDITHREAIEKEALKAKELSEANKTMKEFMDNISHELRTPMNAIIGISNMLLKYNAENLQSKQVEGLQIINQSGIRLLDMINDVLDLSKIDSGKVTVTKEEFDLEKLLASIRSIVISLIDNKDIKFTILKSPQVPSLIYSDQKKLNQILLNLLGNAVKFTSKGKIHLFVHVKGEKMIFEVTDTGIGISEENLSVIFERFRQIDNSGAKEYKGTGLGLNISKSFIELLGGNISVESTPGKGTTMSFNIPIEVMPTATETKKPSIPLNVCEQLNESINPNLPLAIVIDDNQQNFYLYSSILRENGYEVLLCMNSSKGLRSIKQFLPDLVLLKFEMPKVHGKFIINEFENHEILSSTSLVITTSTENLKLNSAMRTYPILLEPVTDKELIKVLENINCKARRIQKTGLFFLFEKINQLSEIVKLDNCYHSLSLPTAKLMIASRKINKLILYGFSNGGIHQNLLHWISENPGKSPEKIILVTENKQEVELAEMIAKGILKERIEILSASEAVTKFQIS